MSREDPQQQFSLEPLARNEQTDELYARFGVPRAPRDGAAAAAAQSQFSSIYGVLQVARSFNPASNYARGGARGRGSTLSSSMLRVTPYRRRQAPAAMMPSSSCSKVPRGAERTELHRKGLQRDAVTFDKEWPESEVIVKIASLFEEQLFDALNTPTG